MKLPLAWPRTEGRRWLRDDHQARRAAPGAMDIQCPLTMKLQLRELAQLFNSMDPSPFRDRDLDADAEEFIVSWARELSPAHELELIIHLVVAPSAERSGEVEEAVRHYFATRAEMKQREFRQLMRRGRTSLLIGLLFLAACIAGSEMLILLRYGTWSNILREGLIIAGWVAMWRPLEIYLYDWWPMRAEERVLERLARMRVRVLRSISDPPVIEHSPQNMAPPQNVAAD